jgi:hypothetical protein
MKVVRFLFLMLTVAALVIIGVKAHDMLRAAARTLGEISWLAVLALPVFCLWTLAAAEAWRRLMASSGVAAIPSLARLWLVRLEAQAVNLVVPLAGLGGEALRAAVLHRQTKQPVESAVSVASDIGSEIAACFAFVVVSASLGWRSIPFGTPARVGLVLSSAAIVVCVRVLPPWLARISGRWSGKTLSRFRALCAAIARTPRAAWWSSLAWHMVERALIAAETWLYARSLGFHLSIVGAAVATAVMTLLSSLLFFVPAQVGAADGGIAIGLGWLGAPWSIGLAVAFARRLRQVLVAIVGLCLLAGTLVLVRKTVRQGAPGMHPVAEAEVPKLEQV